MQLINFAKMATAFLGILAGLASVAMAKTIETTDEFGATLAYNSVGIQGPSFDRTSRPGVELAGYYPLFTMVTGQLSLHLMPDSRKPSGRVDVREDFYWVNPRIKIAYPYLFRFGLSAGPTVVVAETRTKFDGTSRSASHYQMGGNLLIEIEYAFERWIELSFRYGWHKRFTDDKLDSLLGLGLSVNFSAF